MARPRTKTPKSVETLTHVDDTRTNIPTAEAESIVDEADKTPIRVAYERRNRDLDPQLVWRGKDEQDWSDLVVHAPPLYIQEKVHPKVLIDDLVRQSKKAPSDQHEQIDLFSDFNGIPDGVEKTEFYQHEQNWTNRMILGDSLQVMASLAEREGLRGKVQCIYIDPPYGIKFNSNFQWSTTTNKVRDAAEHITREPEQVKAFRDTWRDGVHSYLTYLRDRLAVSRDLLTDSGSIFVQIGDENVHRVRSLLDEIFGEDNFVSLIQFRTKIPLNPIYIGNVCDFLLWYAKDRESLKFRRIYLPRSVGADTQFRSVQLSDGTERAWTKDELDDPTLLPEGSRPFRLTDLVASGYTESCHFEFYLDGKRCYPPGRNSWKTTPEGMERLVKANRVRQPARIPNYQFFFDDYPVMEFTNQWSDTQGALSKKYVVQTATKVVERCVLMSSDPGDLVLDPTCGSGTTAMVAERWGRRWITVDTSRVALALARARIMGARLPYFLLADSRAGQLKEAELTGAPPSSQPVHQSIRRGFVVERVPHITLGSIANNAAIDVIWERWDEVLKPLRAEINGALKESWEEWEIPRDPDDNWSEDATRSHAAWWEARIARQKEIDASISVKAEFEYLYDKPYEDKRKVRVAGPFTVESLSPHRVLAVGADDELIDPLSSDALDADAEQTFAQTILENLKAAGVQQAHKEDRIAFTSLAPWPGTLICGEGRYVEGDGEGEKRAAIFVGPEFGTVQRADLVAAAREAGDAGFDVLIACTFNYEAHATEFSKLGRIPVLKARMNADLHMADDLKNTGKGNLFVIFGEPDIDLLETDDGRLQVKLNGVDVFHPSTGEVQSDNAAGIACWFVDTDYNEESFFVRHAYFLGADDPYKALKTTLKAEIDEDAWASLHSDLSRPFDKPETGRIAVKVINHLGDEVMKVFRVS